MCSRCLPIQKTHIIYAVIFPPLLSPRSLYGSFVLMLPFNVHIHTCIHTTYFKWKKNVWKYCKIGAHKWVFNIHNNRVSVSRRCIYIYIICVRNENPNEMRVFYTEIYIHTNTGVCMIYRNARVLFIFFSSFVCLFILFYVTYYIFVFAI